MRTDMRLNLNGRARILGRFAGAWGAAMAALFVAATLVRLAVGH